MNQNQNNLKIIISSYDVESIEKATKSIYQEVLQSKMKSTGVIPLPTKEKKETFRISPHKHGNAQEAFIRRTHRRMIIIQDISPRNLEHLKNQKIPNTVGIKLKTSF